MSNITTQDLIDEVRKIAKEMPDFVYATAFTKGCSYFGRQIGDPTGQCCIMGQAFKNLGVDTSKIDESHEGVSTVGGLILDNLIPVTYLNNSQVEWLDNVQRLQDEGFSWGETVVIADFPPPSKTYRIPKF